MYIGNFVGPLVFKPADAPRYVSGFIIVTVTSIAAGFLVLAYRLLCMRENKKRDKAGILEGYEHAYEDDLTDKKVSVHPLATQSPQANQRNEESSVQVYFVNSVLVPETNMLSDLFNGRALVLVGLLSLDGSIRFIQ